MTLTITPIETSYAGCRFRSRLEARWAVFFDAIGAGWEYEPQGFVISGRPYLPDFLLTDCGTWVEAKGNPDDLDVPLLEAAAAELPQIGRRNERPTLLLLGPIPGPCPSGDWAWLGLDQYPADEDLSEWIVLGGQYGFGGYRTHRSLCGCSETSSADHHTCGSPLAEWLIPNVDMGSPSVPDAYKAARSARFEHGERG
jgi:hypothetical protein